LQTIWRAHGFLHPLAMLLAERGAIAKSKCLAQAYHFSPNLQSDRSRR